MVRWFVRVGAVLALGTGFAMAQTDSPFGGFKHDSSLPIEVTADALEVRQTENLAIFTGDVIAGQGTLRLTADKVFVTYGSGGGGDSSTGAITNLRAEGNVFLSNGAETAEGAWAEYDVEAGTIRMGGGVLLTQGGNAIRSQTLFIDLNAGVGRVDGGGGRVQTVFEPVESSD